MGSPLTAEHFGYETSPFYTPESCTADMIFSKEPCLLDPESYLLEVAFSQGHPEYHLPRGPLDEGITPGH